MKTNFGRVIALCLVAFFSFLTTACAAQRTHEQELSRKAILLTIEACDIYPIMMDLDKCTDMVVRKILASRGATSELQDELIARQAEQSAVRHPVRPGDEARTPGELHGRKLGDKVLDIIEVACAIAPAITDLDTCMDRTYHSIIASRDPHSAYFNQEEFAELVRYLSGELQGIGAEIALTEDKAIGVVKVMPGSPAEKAGMLDGDRIIAITSDTKNGTERGVMVNMGG